MGVFVLEGRASRAANIMGDSVRALLTLSLASSAIRPRFVRLFCHCDNPERAAIFSRHQNNFEKF